MEPVTISGVYTAEDLMAARQYMARRSPVIRLIRLILFAIPFILVLIYILRQGILLDEMLVILIVGAFAAWFGVAFLRFVSRPIQFFLTRRKMKSSRTLAEKKVFRLDLAGLSWETELSKGSYDWMMVLSIEESAVGFFLMTGRGEALFLPRSFFKMPESLARAREIMAAALPGKTNFIAE